MPRYAAFHRGLHRFQKFSFGSCMYQYTNSEDMRKTQPHTVYKSTAPSRSHRTLKVTRHHDNNKSKSKKLSLPNQNYCETRKENKYCAAKTRTEHRASTNNGNNNKQWINSLRTDSNLNQWGPLNAFYWY